MSEVLAPASVGLHHLVSALLQYPERDCRELFEEAREAAGGIDHPDARGSVQQFLDEVAGYGFQQLRSHYVDTFDFDKAAALHVTYHVWGDQRARGQQLAKLVGHYVAAGMELETSELPDYLPLMLEFCSVAERDAGLAVLQAYREPIELIRERLGERESPYRHLLDAVCVALPKLSTAQREAIKELAESEPPDELVGLSAYGEEMADARVPGGGCG